MCNPLAQTPSVLICLSGDELVTRMVYAGPCRNDTLSGSDSAFLLVTLILHGFALPIAKSVYELTFYFRREDGEITMSQSEEWRKRLRYPVMDIFLVLSPILGGLLFPEGHQTSEDKVRGSLFLQPGPVTPKCVVLDSHSLAVCRHDVLCGIVAVCDCRAEHACVAGAVSCRGTPRCTLASAPSWWRCSSSSYRARCTGSAALEEPCTRAPSGQPSLSSRCG